MVTTQRSEERVERVMRNGASAVGGAGRPRLLTRAAIGGTRRLGKR
jgi:hypothetical protein